MNKKKFVILYGILLLVCIGMLWNLDAFLIHMREMAGTTFQVVKYAAYTWTYEGILTLLICLIHFLGRFVKMKIYVGGSAAMIIILAFIIYKSLFHYSFGYLIVISIVFVVEFILEMADMFYRKVRDL